MSLRRVPDPNPNVIGVRERSNPKSTHIHVSRFSKRQKASSHIGSSVPFGPSPKTPIFENEKAVADFYEIQICTPQRKEPVEVKKIHFVNPPRDSLISSMIITFIAANFPFFSELNRDNQKLTVLGRIDISQTFQFLENMNPKTSEISGDEHSRVSYFIELFHFLNFHIEGPLRISSFDSVASDISQLFAKRKMESIVFTINDSELLPPEIIHVPSAAVAKATSGKSSFLIEFRARWAIVRCSDEYFPVIIRDNTEVDVLYHLPYCYNMEGAIKNNHFGSLKSMIYSGLVIVVICYSRNRDCCPDIMDC